MFCKIVTIVRGNLETTKCFNGEGGNLLKSLKWKAISISNIHSSQYSGWEGDREPFLLFVDKRWLLRVCKGRVKKKTGKKRSGWPLWGWGGSPPLSLTTSICENFDPNLSFIKRQNNPKYGNLSRNFHIFLTASGEGRGGSTQAVSLTAFSQFFFLNPSLSEVVP